MSSSSSHEQQQLSSVIPLNMNSYDGKLMFAAIISLLLVISFVLLLHAYARWVFLLGQSAHRRRRRAALSLSTTTTTITTRFHRHLHSANDSTTDDDDEMDGLDVAVIAAIPTFVHKLSDFDDDVCRLECVICLSVFEDGETGRHLPNCNHAFHVQCIDRWLQSHSSCPICRALVGGKNMAKGKSVLVSSSIDHVLHTEIEMRPPPPPLPLPLESILQGNVERDSSPPLPPPPAVKQQLPVVSYSLRRLLSMSRGEHKVFPSSSSSSSSCCNVNDLNV